MVYIKIEGKEEKYQPEEWYFTAYQLLEIYIDEDKIQGAPFVIANGQPTELSKKANYWELPSGKAVAAGIIEIVFKLKDGEECKYKLHISPSILTIDELQDMAKTISTMMLNHISFTLANVNIPKARKPNYNINTPSIRENDKKDWNYFNFLIDKLPQFLEIIRNNLKEIEQKPALSMHLDKKEIPIIRSRNPKDLIKRKQQPFKRMALSYAKVYDDFSIENQWLGYIVFDFLEHMISTLEKECENKKEQVREIHNQLKSIQSIKFLKKFNLNFRYEPNYTTRLSRKHGYSEIFEEYQKLFNHNIVEVIDFSRKIDSSYSRKDYVNNLSKIYEYWVLFVLYDYFTMFLNFEVDGKKLDEYVDYNNTGTFKLKENVKINFFKDIDENKKIKVSLYYEPKLSLKLGSPKEPDIYVEIDLYNKLDVEKKFLLILDAKFKNYCQDNNGRDIKYTDYISKGKKIDFLDDLFEVAMYRYHYQLKEFSINEEEREQAGMSMILHPNNNLCWTGSRSIYTYLSQCNNKKIQLSIHNLKQYVQKHKETNKEKTKKEKEKKKEIWLKIESVKDYWGNVAHKFGSLTIRPETYKEDIQRLLSIIFHYHMGLTYLCLKCGHILQKEEEFLVPNQKISKTVQLKNYKKQVKEGIIENNAPFDENGERIDWNWKDSKPSVNFKACCSQCQNEWLVLRCRESEAHPIIVPVPLDKGYCIHHVTEKGDILCSICGGKGDI